MRIGINARCLQNVRSGIAQYTYNLLSNLRAADNKNEYLLFLGSNKQVSDDILKLQFINDVSKFPTTNQILKVIWQHFYLPYRIKDLKLDIFHDAFKSF